MRRRPMRFLHPNRARASLGLAKKMLLLSIVLGGLLLLLPAATVAGSASLDITYNIDGVLGQNGWYRGSRLGNSVIVYWHISPSTAVVISGCEQGKVIPGPTTAATTSCHAQNGADDLTRSVTVKIDATPPTGVSVSASRKPDTNGWYNRPVAFTWHGGDATSGLAGCSSATYKGPDNGSAAVTGSCVDRAGNRASSSFGFSYDATAPVLSKVGVASEASADVVHWNSTSSADTVIVQRWARGNKEHPTVFRNAGTKYMDRRVQSGLEYLYAVQSVDQAGNASKRITVAGLPKVLTLRKMAYVPRAARKPILRWAPVRRASYYHVQLFRGSKRILAAWPTSHQLGLPRAWKWGGHHYRLGPGRYRWYVWAGLGRRTFANYKTVGSARFIVPR